MRALALALLLLFPGAAQAQEDHSGLTRAKYVRGCLMCHNRAAPEGISPAILTGLYPERGLTPAVAMPGLTCWRRCATCFPPERKPAR
ncbi:hypothetical protein [Sphingobium sp. CAP-1]|uniref:hypothetical protein n=1 Tax=Sphingobium sp. CAP-1 TaxID=2676077 RepID=UPI0012BB44B7|nr:hypothetical protein [Sphingobium sp. CAP-1]QGP79093.1 hypothetical protein GL174_08855 [Sphingobium sp. CAP-1]